MDNIKPQRQPPFPPLRYLTLLCLLLSLGGCSLKMSYPFMDWWLSWTVRDYIDLNKPQRQLLEAQLDNFHRWHQQTQLKQYAKFVEQLSTQLDQPLTEDKLQTLNQDIQQHWLESLDYLIPSIDQMFVSLNSKQWQKLLSNITASQESYSRPFLKSNKQRIKQREKRFISGAKRWVGKLNTQQQHMIHQWAQQLHPTAQLSLTRQAQWNDDASKLFNQRHELDSGSRQQRIRRLLTGDLDNLSTESQQVLSDNRQQTYQLLINLQRSLTEKQRRKLWQRLTNYHADFHFLSSKFDAIALAQ